MNSLPIIHGRRVLLRSLLDTDLDSIYTIFSHPEVMRYWSFPPLPDKAAAEKLLAGIIDDVEHGAMMKWGIARQADDTVIGTVTLFNVNLENQRAELGYALGREHWGQGFMNEALQSLLEYAFEILQLRRLEADVDPRNDSSIRTLERLGFQREGYLRERWHVAGEIQDALFYGLLKREWKMSDML
jgi:RimJ/RimL family protein N-acetyltransferase